MPNPTNRKMVNDLLDVEAGLSGWELDFIERMDELLIASRNLTEGQELKLQQVWDERI